MKLFLFSFFALILVLPCFSGPIDPEELRHAWKMSGEVYLANRDQMVERFREETGELSNICGDPSAPWESRIMAGVCRSRMDHAGELDAFLGQDWKQDREFDTSWIPMITGFPLELDALVQKRMLEADHWYLYLELFAGKYDLSGSLRPFRAVDGLMKKCPRPEIRYLAARICEDIVQKSYARSGNIAGSHAGLLRNFVEDGTYPDGAKTLILDLKPNYRYSSSHVLPLIQALSSVSELTKLKDRLNLPRDVAFIDDRIRELQNSESTNRLSVSQTLAAEGGSESKTAAAPDPVPEREPPSSSTRSVFRMVLLFSLGFVLGIVSNRLWLSRKGMD